MNHLGHLFLAESKPISLIGNLAADHLKGAIDPSIGSEMARAIRLHRSVDAFTDSHPAPSRSRKRLESSYRHYGRIIVDVFYDHFLARNWSRYSEEPFDRFVSRMYGVLTDNLDLVPGPLSSVLPRMIADDWLGRTGTVEGIRRALFHISNRLKRGARLEGAITILERDRQELEDDFLKFFPDVIAHVEMQRERSV